MEEESAFKDFLAERRKMDVAADPSDSEDEEGVVGTHVAADARVGVFFGGRKAVQPLQSLLPTTRFPSAHRRPHPATGPPRLRPMLHRLPCHWRRPALPLPPARGVETRCVPTLALDSLCATRLGGLLMGIAPYADARSTGNTFRFAMRDRPERSPRGGPWGCCWRSCSSHAPGIRRTTALGSRCSRMASAWRRGKQPWLRGWPPTSLSGNARRTTETSTASPWSCISPLSRRSAGHQAGGLLRPWAAAGGAGGRRGGVRRPRGRRASYARN